MDELTPEEIERVRKWEAEHPPTIQITSDNPSDAVIMRQRMYSRKYRITSQARRQKRGLTPSEQAEVDRINRSLQLFKNETSNALTFATLEEDFISLHSEVEALKKRVEFLEQARSEECYPRGGQG